VFCQECGTEAPEGIRYCKRCGSNLGAVATTGRQTPGVFGLLGMFLPLALISAIGLIGLFATIDTLSRRSIDPGLVLEISLIVGATILGVVGLFGWLLLKVQGIEIGRREAAKPKSVETREAAARIMPGPVTMTSVTEHTTRNFEARHDKELERQ
jgi:hypothetical protein